MDLVHGIGTKIVKKNSSVCRMCVEIFQKEYPPTEYLQYPITGRGKLVQVWANAGHGKTWFCMGWSCAIANAQDFLKWKCTDKAEPYLVLYVVGGVLTLKISKNPEVNK